MIKSLDLDKTVDRREIVTYKSPYCVFKVAAEHNS